MSIDSHRYVTIGSARRQQLLAALAALMLSAGLYCGWYITHSGHHVTGMTNRVVWGIPHVFAISLIVAASGALNAATLASLWSVSSYRPWARLSVVLGVSLLAGGLLVLVVDLGRPDRLTVALTHWNRHSVFSWNVLLYSGFALIGCVYLWVLMERARWRLIRATGALALLWRLLLTTGTGTIFALLVARESLNTWILIPLFICLSLVLGTAVFIVALAWLSARRHSPLVREPLLHSGRLLFYCLLALLALSLWRGCLLFNGTEHQLAELALLRDYPGVVFWIGHGLAGTLLPIILLRRGAQSHKSVLLSAVAAIGGGVALIWHLVIGSQLLPVTVVSGYQIVADSFGGQGMAVYRPTGWEFGLGLAGGALALLLFTLLMRVLPLYPEKVSAERPIDRMKPL